MNRRRTTLLFCGAIGLALSWFIIVDWSWFVENCPNCCHQREIYQYRLFGFSLSEQTKEHHTPIEFLAADLNVPCLHPNLQKWHKHRWWGLTYCAHPCINGIYGVSGDSSSYTPEMSERAKHMLAKD